MAKDPLTHVICLPDGRRLAYTEFGNKNGPVIFHFHGLPGSRLEARLLADGINQVGIRLIAVDRPGTGMSDFLPNRRISQWPADIVALADSLGLDKFAVEGFSGGGPYALACVLFIPERITACGLISSVGPPDMDGDQSKGYVPGTTMRQTLKLSASFAWSGFAKKCLDIRSATSFVERELTHIFPGGPDAALGRQHAVQTIFAANFHEAFRQGSEGVVHENILLNLPWGFSLSKITSKVPVYLWHGELDANVPIGVGRALARKISHSHSTIYPQEGHISVPINHASEILQVLGVGRR